MRFFDADARARLHARYGGRPLSSPSYATVRDYCDSADWLGGLCGTDGDLKNVQRPWMVKAALACVPAGGRLLEIGAGEPLVAAALADLGYQVTTIDPYDGSGFGPTAHAHFVSAFPQVRVIQGRFGRDTPELAGETFDAVYSVSVLEHITHDALPAVFRGIAGHLRPGGHSIHCVDHVLAGLDVDYHVAGLTLALAWQEALGRGADADEAACRLASVSLQALLETAGRDLETFFLSPQGHQLWRGGVAYDAFPFRKVISVQTAVATPATRRR